MRISSRATLGLLRSDKRQVRTAGPVTIDHLWYPHIIDSILQHPRSWIPMRTTSKTYDNRVTNLMYHHVRLDSSLEHYDCDCPQFSGCPFRAAQFDHDPAIPINILSLQGNKLPLLQAPWDHLPRPAEVQTKKKTAEHQLFLARAWDRLQETTVIDIPFQFHRSDVEWFTKSLISLQTVRYYWSQHLEGVRTGGDFSFAVPLTAATVVIGPERWTRPQSPRGLLRDFPRSVTKVVVNVPYSCGDTISGPLFQLGPMTFIVTNPEEEPPFMIHTLVYIFHSFQPQRCPAMDDGIKTCDRSVSTRR